VFDPYPGTLNLRLSDAEMLRRWREVRARGALRWIPPPEQCGGRLVPLVVAVHIPASVIVPDVTRYAGDVLEVIVAVHLRSRPGLRDGDLLAVTVHG